MYQNSRLAPALPAVVWRQIVALGLVKQAFFGIVKGMSSVAKTPENLLHGIGLTQGFVGQVLFHDLTISLDAGQIMILRGDNGSGKTTLLRMLAGLMPPLAGEITIAGKPLHQDRVRAASKMIFIGHRDGLAAELTACEAIALWAKTRGFSPTQSDLSKAFETLNLSICMHQPVRVLSAGQRRRGGMVRLALMQAMSAPVPLWLLDEPTTAMDDSAVHVFAEMLDLHADQGGAVLMTSHLDLPLKNSRNVMLSDLEVRS